MHFSKYPNKMPEVSSFEFFASQNIPQNIWFHSIFNIYERYTKSICRDIYVIRYQIYEDSVFTVHIFLRHLEISQMYLIHAPRDNFSHWECITILTTLSNDLLSIYQYKKCRIKLKNSLFNQIYINMNIFQTFGLFL